MTEFKTDISENGKKFELVFQTDIKAYFEKMQATARECIDHKPVTQFDRIKAMSVEEMAEMLLDESENHFTYCNYCSHQSYYTPHCSSTDFETDCRYAVKEWLNSEVEEC